MSQAPVQVVPVETKFDFLEGAFSKAEKTRWTLLALSLITAAVLLVLMFMGISASLASQQAISEKEEATIALGQANQELAVLDTFDGFSAAQLREHVASRKQTAANATKEEVQLGTILGGIYNAVPAGVNITSVTLTPSAPADPSTVAPADPSAAPVAPVTPTGATLTITATATSFGAVNAFIDNLEKVPYFSNVTYQWGGGGESWTVTVNTTMTDTAKSPRSIEFSETTGAVS